MAPTCGFCGFAIPNMFDNDRALLNLRLGGEFDWSLASWGKGTGTEGMAGCWLGCGRGGIGLGVASLGNVLVLGWELLNIVCGRKVCILMRDRRLVGPGEPLDLVVPALWDDRGVTRSTSPPLESAGGESSRFLYPKSQNGTVRPPLPNEAGSD